MRYAVTFETPIEVGNAFEKDPRAGEALAQIVEQAKPEAAYFSCISEVPTSSKGFLIFYGSIMETRAEVG